MQHASQPRDWRQQNKCQSVKLANALLRVDCPAMSLGLSCRNYSPLKCKYDVRRA